MKDPGRCFHQACCITPAIQDGFQFSESSGIRAGRSADHHDLVCDKDVAPIDAAVFDRLEGITQFFEICGHLHRFAQTLPSAAIFVPSKYSFVFRSTSSAKSSPGFMCNTFMLSHFGGPSCS